MKGNRVAPFALLFTSLLWLWGCTTITAPFDQQALDQAQGLKASAHDVMALASQPFSANAAAVTSLRTRLNDAVTAAKSRPNNQQAAKQWEILADPKGNLLGGFLTRWEQQGKLSPTFITEAQNLVSSGFDQIIQLEEGRRH